VIQLICAMQANSPGAINHPFQCVTDHCIHYIDQLVKFNCGMAKTTFVNINEQILTVSWKNSIFVYGINFAVKCLSCVTRKVGVSIIKIPNCL